MAGPLCPQFHQSTLKSCFSSSLLFPRSPTTPEFPFLVRTRRSHSGNSTFKDLFERKLSQVPPCEQSQGKRFWQLGLSSSPPTLPRAPPSHCHLLLPPPQTCSLLPGQQQHLAHLGCVWCFLATLAETVWGEVSLLLFPPLLIIVQAFRSFRSFSSLHGLQFAHKLLVGWMCPGDGPEPPSSTWWHPQQLQVQG